MAKTKGPVVISVLNMKGGVGKTTISANVFRELFRDHMVSTLLVDFDPQYKVVEAKLKAIAKEIGDKLGVI